MLKILSLDPSGTGTTGIHYHAPKNLATPCALRNLTNLARLKGYTEDFLTFTSPEWKLHLEFISKTVRQMEPTILLYESTNYINSRGKDMTSLFKLMGALEGLAYTFTFIKQIESIPVHQVKDLKAKLLAGTKQIKDLTCQPGRGKGWMFNKQRISLHQLDAYLVYYLWKEKNG